jgi:hypothetical protein
MPSKLFFDNESSDFEYSTTLSGNEYILRFVWNTVSESWYMYVTDYLGDNVVHGVRLVSSKPLIDIYKSFNLPDGILAVVQLKEGQLETPSRYSFSEGSHEIWYFTEEEINEITQEV